MTDFQYLAVMTGLLFVALVLTVAVLRDRWVKRRATADLHRIKFPWTTDTYDVNGPYAPIPGENA